MPRLLFIRDRVEPMFTPAAVFRRREFLAQVRSEVRRQPSRGLPTEAHAAPSTDRSANGTERPAKRERSAVSQVGGRGPADSGANGTERPAKRERSAVSQGRAGSPADSSANGTERPAKRERSAVSQGRAGSPAD